MAKNSTKHLTKLFKLDGLNALNWISTTRQELLSYAWIVIYLMDSCILPLKIRGLVRCNYFSFCRWTGFVFHLCAVNTATVSHPAIFVVLLGLVSLTALCDWLKIHESYSRPIRGKNKTIFSPVRTRFLHPKRSKSVYLLLHCKCLLECPCC